MPAALVTIQAFDSSCKTGCCVCFAAGEAITFYTEDDSWQLRSIVNVVRTAGCKVPDWMLHLKKERRKRHNKAGKQVDPPLEQNKEQMPERKLEQEAKACTKEKVVRRQNIKA